MVNSCARNWAFFKADRESAYKQFPMDSQRAELSVIDLLSPTDKRWYGFIIRAMLFGAVAAVLRYNFFSRMISGIPAQLFGPPLLCFFDDFGPIAPDELSESALLTFTLFFPNLGIRFKIVKSGFWRRVTFLGLEGDSPCASSGFRLLVALAPEKAGN